MSERLKEMTDMFGAFLLLGVAIVIEVCATALLPKAEGFTNAGWATVVLAGYGLSIWMLTVVVRQMPVSVAYAVWAGAGTRWSRSSDCCSWASTSPG